MSPGSALLQNMYFSKISDIVFNVVFILSFNRCRSVMSEFQKTYGVERPNCQVTAKQIMAYTFSLQNAITEAQTKLNKCVEKMQSEGLPDARVKYEQSYVEIKERILEFAKIDKKSGLAVELVTLTGLCAVNRRFIQMEVAAKSEWTVPKLMVLPFEYQSHIIYYFVFMQQVLKKNSSE